MDTTTAPGHRAFTTNANDHGGVAITMTTLFMTWSILCYIIRLYIRFGIAQTLGLDDLFCSLATFTGVVQTVICCVSIAQGFGKSVSLLSHSQVQSISKMQYSGDCLYIVTLFLAKCSMVFFYKRVSCVKKHKIASHVLLVGLSIWAVGSMVAQGLRCGPEPPWQLVDLRCSHLLSTWTVIAAFDIISEIAIFAFSIWIVWTLQMPFKNKFAVVFAISLRLPGIVPTIARIISLPSSIHSNNFTFAGVFPFICTEVEMHYSTMATTIPCLRPFIKSFNTGWGTVDPRSVGHAMTDLVKSMGDKNSEVRSDSAGEGNSHRLREAMADQSRPPSSNSDESQQMIIYKTVSTRIEYRERQS